MNPTTLNTVVGIVGAIVGIIGIIAGIIGMASVTTAIKIKNSVQVDNDVTVFQTQTINHGVSDDTVRLIAQKMTKEEMCRLLIRLIPINTDDDNCVGNRLRNGTLSVEDIDKILDEIPTLYVGETLPPDASTVKDGSIWLTSSKK